MGESGAAKIETVLCAFDFSETTETALEQAIRFARRHLGRLVLAHAVEPIPHSPYHELMVPLNEVALVDTVQKRIEATAQTLRNEGVEVEVRVEQGSPGPQLISMAEAVGADLIVIGTRGLTGLKHLLMGSTAEYVLRRSRCPVLTVHPEDRALGKGIETVILPSDLSSSAANAVKTFISLFGQWERPRVVLVYADRTPPYLEPFRHKELASWHQPDSWKDEIDGKLAPVADLLRRADFDVEVTVLDGDPVSVTTALAEKCNADLVLLSTQGRSALANTLLGRTAQRIAQNAPCPVLTVRPRGSDRN